MARAWRELEPVSPPGQTRTGQWRKTLSQTLTWRVCHSPFEGLKNECDPLGWQHWVSVPLPPVLAGGWVGGTNRKRWRVGGTGGLEGKVQKHLLFREWIYIFVLVICGSVFRVPCITLSACVIVRRMVTDLLPTCSLCMWHVGARAHTQTNTPFLSRSLISGCLMFNAMFYSFYFVIQSICV